MTGHSFSRRRPGLKNEKKGSGPWDAPTRAPGSGAAAIPGRDVEIAVGPKVEVAAIVVREGLVLRENDV